ncbi:MAG: hypothetical protein AAB484_00325 [Patescibacteria group bacterium]
MKPKPVEKKPRDLGSAEVKIQQVIRWKVEDPFLFLNMTGSEQVERTIIAYSKSITRAIASMVELDSLIALKLEVGQRIHKCFQKEQAQNEPNHVENKVKEIKTRHWSVGVGIVFVFLLAILPFTVFRSMDVVPSICMIVFAIGLGIAGTTKIEMEHVGVLTILGARTHKYVSEGYQWVLWPFVSYILVDMREHLIELKSDDRVIKVIAGNAKGAGNTIPEDISVQINDSFRNDSGVNVLEVLCSAILPVNLDILRAREALLVEIAKSDAQDEDMRRQGERAKELRQHLPGLPPIEALRAVQAQEGDLIRDEMIVTGADGAERFVGLLALAAKKFGIKTGDGGNQQRRRKHNRNQN